MVRITILAFFILSFSYSYFSQTGWKLYRQLPTLQESINPSTELKTQIIDSPIIPIMRTCDGIPLYKLNGVCIGKIASLVCGSGKLSEPIKSQVQVTGVTYSIIYSSGNGGTYQTQELSSTGVTGLVAKLTGSNFNLGNGTLSFSISGKASGAGVAKFDLSIGGQQCSLEVTVIESVTPTSGNGPTITDVEGNVYKTVYIGTQHWMGENLRTSKYQDGTVIPNIKENTQWSLLTSGAWCNYNNDVANNSRYGKLYNWYAISPSTNGNKNVCPSGWHVPTDAEWTVLTNYLGGYYVAGGKMKEFSTTNWLSPNTDASNSSLFTGLPGGNRHDEIGYMNIGFYGFWWSSTENNTYFASSRSIYFYNGYVYRNGNVKKTGFSVRCLRD